MKTLLTEFIQEILSQVDHFKDHTQQRNHLKKITDAENRALEAQHQVEELKAKLAEKESLLKVSSGQLADQQNMIENLNIQMTDLKDEMSNALMLQAHEHERFVENLKTQQASETSRQADRIKELENEAATLRADCSDFKAKVAEIEAKLAQVSKGQLSRHHPQGHLQRAARPVHGSVQGPRGGQEPAGFGKGVGGRRQNQRRKKVAESPGVR